MNERAGTGGVSVQFEGEATPDQVWSELQANPGAALIDVRTQPEWAFVGVPDLTSVGKQAWLLSWRSYPEMARDDARFFAQLGPALEKSGVTKLFFICRSGGRSMEAAMTAAEALPGSGGEERESGAAPRVAAVNIREGFEGDLDETKHRGRLNGWKARGLPWTQS